MEQRYVTWCERCDWNVDPTPVDNPYPAWRHRLEHRLADKLYRELEQGAVHRPGWDAARAAAYVLSALVLLLPIAAGVAGVAVLLLFRPFWLSVPIALVAFGVAWLFRPRADRLDPEDHLVTREQAPRLYDVLDRIAAAIGTQEVAAVVLDTEPNLSFARVGWRFRPVVRIGLPLWFAFRPQERVAILAHELGHGRNGDARHGWVVGGARSILGELHAAFSEQPLDEFRRDLGYHPDANEDEAYVNFLTRLTNAVVAPPIRGYIWLLDKVDLRSSQRAEYLADRRAGEIAGSEAAASAMERLVLADTAYRALERALRFDRDSDPLEAVRRAVADVPGREIERRLRVSRIRETRSDHTHPPTYLRTRLIRARRAESATVVLGLSDAATIDRELAAAGAAPLTELRRAFPTA